MDKLQIKDLCITYHTLDGETEAVKNLNLNIRDGEFISIVGPSGCGKSTVLSAIAGLVPISSGEIILDGKSIIPSPNNKIGYMLQKDHLFEWRTIYQNIKLGLEVQNSVTFENLDKINQMLLKYGLAGFKDYYPSQLSGGMRQRAALIRTLALDPKLLLLDEPFSAIDYQTRLSVSNEIYKIIKEEKKTSIMVTHDISEAVSMSDRVIVLSKRPASVKNIYEIKFSIENKTPLSSREAPEFKEYFNAIWRELDIHV
ncbi:ABC transporter ATP-binding protein [Clostridium cylindrosporum]|uniref:ABC-type nitrate/sulfonate/bicarbonate transport system, ATPase component n=1 Tax=Clostridium cylindrosporum DSM 605 TaxID=1121307 RepID=A0A0J8DET0_CLOCY|nr:ABC-type nitrate/sulfonate/bicarbonate transport system, ATPase component [Clostridium cylindrosporum DSM 605]